MTDAIVDYLPLITVISLSIGLFLFNSYRYSKKTNKYKKSFEINNKNEIKKNNKDTDEEEIQTPNNNNNKINKDNFEEKLFNLIKQTDEEKQREEYYEKLDKKLPLTLKLKKYFRELDSNPYNTISLVNLVLCSVVFFAIGFVITLPIYQSLIISFALSCLVFSIPYTVISFIIYKNKLKIMYSNMNFMTTFYSVYSESSSLADCLVKTTELYRKDTREYKILNDCRELLNYLSIPQVIERMSDAFLADKIMCDFFTTVYQAETRSPDYKKGLEIFVRRIEKIAHNNARLANSSLIIYYIYLFALLATLGTTVFYKFFQEETANYLYGTLSGQLLISMVFVLYIVLNLRITSKLTFIEDYNKRYVKAVK